MPGPTDQDLDPTPRTFDIVRSEVAGLGRQLDIKIAALEKAQQAFEDSITRVPTEVDKRVGSTERLFEQRLATLDATFQGSREYIAVALQSAKELVEQQNRSNAAAIGKTEVLLQTSIAALEGKIDDLKDRITVIESRKEGGTAANAATIYVVLAFATLASLGISMATYLGKSEPERIYVSGPPPGALQQQ